MNMHPHVRVASWMASMYAAIGNLSAAESYVMSVLSWYVTSGGRAVFG